MCWSEDMSVYRSSRLSVCNMLAVQWILFSPICKGGKLMQSVVSEKDEEEKSDSDSLELSFPASQSLPFMLLATCNKWLCFPKSYTHPPPVTAVFF